MKISLVGFVAELTGSDDHLLEAQPAVEIDGQILVAPGLDWTVETLVPYQAQSSTPLHRITSATEITVGDTVWIAGRSFVTRAKKCSTIADFAYEIGGWPATALGFRASFGHRRAFADMVRSLRYNLERGLNQALFDHANLLHFTGPILHELYAALPLEPDLEYQLTRALVFDGERDEYSLEFIRAESVHLLGLAASEEEFDAQLEAKRRRLAASRLGEQANVGWLPLSQNSSHNEVSVDTMRKIVDSIRSRTSAPSESEKSELLFTYAIEQQSAWGYLNASPNNFNEKV